MLKNQDSVEKYKFDIKSLNEKFDSQQEKNIDLETKLLEKERRFSNEKAKCEEQMTELKKKIEELNTMLSMSENEVKSLESKFSNDQDKSKIDYEIKIKEVREENEVSNSKLKET